MSQAERKVKIDLTHFVAVSRQCQILSISRSSAYYRPQGSDKSVKYEEVYLHAYDSIPQARDHLKRYFEFYNAKQKHQTLKATPDQVYYAHLPSLKKAG